MEFSKNIGRFPKIAEVYGQLMELYDLERGAHVEETMNSFLSCTKMYMQAIVKKQNFERAQLLLPVLHSAILHLHMRQSELAKAAQIFKKKDPKILFLRLLSSLVDLFLLLSLSNDMYLKQAVQVLHRYTADNPMSMCIVLLHCNLVKKSYSRICQPLLGHVLHLVSDHTLQPKEYLRCLYLLRLWDKCAKSQHGKTDMMYLASKLKPSRSEAVKLKVQLVEVLTLFASYGQPSSMNQHDWIHNFFLHRKLPHGFLHELRKHLCEDDFTMSKEMPASSINTTADVCESNDRDPIEGHISFKALTSNEAVVQSPLESRGVLDPENTPDGYPLFFIDTTRNDNVNLNEFTPEQTNVESDIVRNVDCINSFSSTKENSSIFSIEQNTKKQKSKSQKKHNRNKTNKQDVNENRNTLHSGKTDALLKVRNKKKRKKLPDDDENSKKGKILSHLTKRAGKSKTRSDKYLFSSSEKKPDENSDVLSLHAKTVVEKGIPSNSPEMLSSLFAYIDSKNKGESADKKGKKKNASPIDDEDHRRKKQKKSTESSSTEEELEVSHNDSENNESDTSENILEQDAHEKITETQLSSELKTLPKSSAEKKRKRKTLSDNRNQKKKCKSKISLRDDSDNSEEEIAQTAEISTKRKVSPKLTKHISNESDLEQENQLALSDPEEGISNSLFEVEAVSTPKRHRKTESNSLVESNGNEKTTPGREFATTEIKQENVLSDDDEDGLKRKAGAPGTPSPKSSRLNLGKVLYESFYAKKISKNPAVSLKKHADLGEAKTGRKSSPKKQMEKSCTASTDEKAEEIGIKKKEEIEDPSCVSEGAASHNNDELSKQLTEHEQNYDSSQNSDLDCSFEAIIHKLPKLEDFNQDTYEDCNVEDSNATSQRPLEFEIKDSFCQVVPIEKNYNSEEDNAVNDSNTAMERLPSKFKIGESFSQVVNMDGDYDSDQSAKNDDATNDSQSATQKSAARGKIGESLSQDLCSQKPEGQMPSHLQKYVLGLFMDDAVEHESRTPTDSSEIVMESVSDENENLSINLDAPLHDAEMINSQLLSSLHESKKGLRLSSTEERKDGIADDEVPTVVTINDSQNDAPMSDNRGTMPENVGESPTKYISPENLENKSKVSPISSGAISPCLSKERKTSDMVSTPLKKRFSLKASSKGSPKSEVNKKEVVVSPNSIALGVPLIESAFNISWNSNTQKSPSKSDDASGTCDGEVLFKSSCEKESPSSSLGNALSPQLYTKSNVIDKKLNNDAVLNQTVRDSPYVVKIVKPLEPESEMNLVEEKSLVSENIRLISTISPMKIIKSGAKNDALVTKRPIVKVEDCLKKRSCYKADHDKNSDDVQKFSLQVNHGNSVGTQILGNDFSNSVAAKLNQILPSTQLRHSTRIKERTKAWKSNGLDFSNVGNLLSMESQTTEKVPDTFTSNKDGSEQRRSSCEVINDDEVFHTPTTSDCESEIPESSQSQTETFTERKSNSSEKLSKPIPGTSPKQKNNDCSVVNYSLRNMYLNSPLISRQNTLPSEECDCKMTSKLLRRSKRVRKLSSASELSESEDDTKQKPRRKLAVSTKLMKIPEASPQVSKPNEEEEPKEEEEPSASQGYNLRIRKQLLAPSKLK